MCFTCEDKILFVRADAEGPWCLPTTFADYRRGETISFAAQRLLVQKYKVLPDVAGLIGIEHGSRSREDPDSISMVR